MDLPFLIHCSQSINQKKKDFEIFQEQNMTHSLFGLGEKRIPAEAFYGMGRSIFH